MAAVELEPLRHQGGIRANPWRQRVEKNQKNALGRLGAPIRCTNQWGSERLSSEIETAIPLAMKENENIEELIVQLQLELQKLEAMVSQLSAEEPASAEDEVMSLTEVSRFFGKCKSTIRRWVKDSQLPARRVPSGKTFRWQFSRNEVVRFFEEDCY